MKFLKVLAFVVLAAAVCMPAFAETQTVKVSGELDVYWIYRSDFDLSGNNDASVIPVGVAPPAPGTTTSSRQAASNSDSYFMSVAEVEVAADLTDNVSVVIRLVNQRDWNSNAFASTSGVVDATGTANATEEFDVIVDLAYVQLKEIWYAPLTLTIGRQDIWLGRGFVIGLNYQDPTGSLAANEFTAVTSFDAIRADLDFDPWTLTSIYVVIDQNENNADDDIVMSINNINYQFADYNAEAELYYIVVADRGTVSGGAAGELNNETHTAGGRFQFDPIENVTLGAEGAWQFGDYAVAVGTSTRDIDAFAGEVFGEYRWNEYEWKPMFGLQYAHLSGDAGTSTTDDYEAWNGLYWGPTWGDIRDYQEVYYATAQSGDQPAHTNQEHVAIYGDISPMEDLKIDAIFYWFWQEEEITVGGGTLDREIGNELDVHITYDYTEDVAFGLGLAWFFPGDLFSGPGATSGSTDFDETATQVVSTVKVAF